MSETTERQLVRQRARFQCENCQQFALAQYAHIIPESDGGEYELNNLLFLCYPCHRTLEPALAKVRLKEARIERMERIRARDKIDNLVQGIFDELMAGTNVVVHIGRGLKFVDTKRIFEEDSHKYPQPSYLDVKALDGMLLFSGNFKDENGKALIHFENTQFKIYTGDFWDIVRKPAKLEIVNLSRKFRLQILQNDDLSISILGKFFLGNLPARATKNDFTLGGNRFIDNTIINSRVGLGIR
ncbi:MAG TPA: HNH endonuclease [Candidatus Saccharimonadales bacterium]|nr:HNH endonuclease [Candidatus Saccharimonadales bacterium]